MKTYRKTPKTLTNVTNAGYNVAVGEALRKANVKASKPRGQYQATDKEVNLVKNAIKGIGLPPGEIDEISKGIAYDLIITPGLTDAQRSSIKATKTKMTQMIKDAEKAKLPIYYISPTKTYKDGTPKVVRKPISLIASQLGEPWVTKTRSRRIIDPALIDKEYMK